MTAYWSASIRSNNKLRKGSAITAATAMETSRAPKQTGNRPGRSRPRSRTGCSICKQRRVRCDELRPVCGHCTRLQLDCSYQTRPRKAQVANVSNGSTGSSHSSHQGLRPQQGELSGQPREPTLTAGIDSDVVHNRGELEGPWPGQPLRFDDGFNQDAQRLPGERRRARFTNHRSDVVANQWTGNSIDLPFPEDNFFDPLQIGTFDAPNAENSFGTFMFADTPWLSPQADGGVLNIPGRVVGNRQTDQSAQSQALGLPSTIQQNSTNRSEVAETQQNARNPNQCQGSITSRSISFSAGSNPLQNDRSSYLLSYFQQIVQPPAAILVSGVHKWRRLRSYLVRMSEHNRAVASALFSLIETLTIDEATEQPGPNNKSSMHQALEWHEAAQREIEFMISRHGEIEQKTKDQLLAAIFLLAWFEVIRDQVTDQTLFPGDLADRVITSNATWNPYSRQLLQWLNTLDSKATHLGGQHLLSPKSLHVVSQHPTQISTTDGSDDEHSDHDSPGDATNASSVGSNSFVFSPNQTHHHHRQHDLFPDCSQRNSVTHASIGQMKQILLNTILQPALDWYLTSQSYCRHISSHDRHHRKRFTVKDEYEVITACKQLEMELFRLWRQRPMIITLMASQLAQIVCADVAVRLEEIFSIYLASFWILFVYLHRVSWWALPHSETAQGALEEAWRNMQRSYGEVVNGGRKKVVHPALLWPLFLFGSECMDESRRNWAIDQLEALGEAKPVVGDEDVDDVLPPFRLSAGATRNAKRAALLLRELIKRQVEQGGRIDEKSLSVELFSCHFSII
jgi:hypothetical protein